MAVDKSFTRGRVEGDLWGPNVEMAFGLPQGPSNKVQERGGARQGSKRGPAAVTTKMRADAVKKCKRLQTQALAAL